MWKSKLFIPLPIVLSPDLDYLSISLQNLVVLRWWRNTLLLLLLDSLWFSLYCVCRPAFSSLDSLYDNPTLFLLWGKWCMSEASFRLFLIPCIKDGWWSFTSSFWPPISIIANISKIYLFGDHWTCLGKSHFPLIQLISLSYMISVSGEVFLGPDQLCSLHSFNQSSLSFD